VRIQSKLVAALSALTLLLVAPAAAEASWAAIAIDPPTGKIGFARHQSTVANAKKKALSECAESHCKAVRLPGRLGLQRAQLTGRA
jgi:hypothetical protein